MTSIDIIVICVYFAVTMLISFFSVRKGSSVDGFTAAEHSMSGTLIGLSILGSFVSSISFLALPGKAYASDWNAFVNSIGLPIATVIALIYFLPFYRKIGNISAYTQLEERFGLWARLYTGLCYLLTQIARMGAVTYLMALPISVLCDWDIYLIIFITGIAVTIYTFLGGIVAVIWTEAIQTTVLLIGTIVCAILITLEVPDGFYGVIEMASSAGKFSLGSFDFDLNSFSQNTFWVILIYGLFINLQNFGIDQNYIQRYVVAKNTKEACKGLLIGGLSYLPISALFLYIGTSLWCFYTKNPNLLPAEYSNKADFVFPYYIISELPVGLRGLLIASVFAAAMSTISCSLNSSATVIMSDYYLRFFSPNASEKSKMRFLRITTLLWGFIGTIAAFVFVDAGSALDVFWLFAGIFSGGMLGIFLLGIAAKQTNSFACACGAIVGIVLIIYLTLSKQIHSVLPFIPESMFHPFLIPAVGTCSIFVVGFILGKILNRKKHV